MKPPLSSASRYSFSIAKSCLLLSSFLPGLHSHPIEKHFFRRDDDDDTVDGAEYWVFLSISVVLVLLGGVFAGLTLGLMGQDEVYLQVIEQSGTPVEQKNARRVLQLLKKGKHWVLVTMLFGNVITNETLPIVLDRCLGGGWPAVVSSTILIVIFGEVIPQSISVRYGLAIGASFAPFVQFLMYAMYPVSYPTALLLDHVLGEDHGTVYRKAQLKTLVTLHRSMGVERLNRDEVTIISAVLDLNEKPVGSIMTPMHDVYTMSADRILDQAAVDEILKAGYSRIPIHTPDEPTNFIGMLLVRILISYDPDDAQPVSTFPLATLPETRPDTTCLNVLNYFQEGKSHMMLVSDSPGEPYGALGVVTLEDVIEELIGEEIVDESDVFVDIAHGIRRKYVSPLTRRTLPAQFVANQKNRSDMTSSVNTIESHSDSWSPHESYASIALLPKRTGQVGGKIEPLNLAINPKQTHNSKVTIKRGAMEEYVRRKSTDYRPGRVSLDPGLFRTIEGGDKRYGAPQNGAHYGKIHDSEAAALQDASADAQASKALSTRGDETIAKNNSKTNSETTYELNIFSNTESPHSDDNVSNRENNLRDTSETAKLLVAGDADYQSGSSADIHNESPSFFRASGIIESIREVHGYQKTIVESKPMSDDEDNALYISNDSGSDAGAGRSGSGLENSSVSKTDGKSRKQKKSIKSDHKSRAESPSSQKKRKGSFFSDRGSKGRK
ncbi:hypothetical protein V1511DRAFT_490815 [Dipodascopsis uninucleata]